jgi:hypothetical protein
MENMLITETILDQRDRKKQEKTLNIYRNEMVES